jgi:hypothetical protein
MHRDKFFQFSAERMTGIGTEGKKREGRKKKKKRESKKRQYRIRRKTRDKGQTTKNGKSEGE